MQSKGQSAIVNFSLSSKISLKKCLSLTPPVSSAAAHPIRHLWPWQTEGRLHRQGCRCKHRRKLIYVDKYKDRQGYRCKHRRKQIYIDKYKDGQGYRCKDRRKQVNMYVQRQTQTYAHFDKNMQTDMHANTDANT